MWLNLNLVGDRLIFPMVLEQRLKLQYSWGRDALASMVKSVTKLFAVHHVGLMFRDTCPFSQCLLMRSLGYFVRSKEALLSVDWSMTYSRRQEERLPSSYVEI